MRICLNGSERELAAPLTVADLLGQSGYSEKRVAVEVNGAIVPRSLHGERTLTEGDRIEVVQAIGGG